MLSSILDPLSSDQPSVVGRRSSVVRFEVEDTGVGIPSDQVERIFRPFEQGGEQMRRAEGVGLGLAISRQLVRLMGGEIQVRSVLGQGSVFWFEIAVPVVQALDRAPVSSRVISGYLGRRRTALIVDDIADNRAVLDALLSRLGFTVREAGDGLEGLAQAQAYLPDLILIDCSMPVLDGREAVRRMRRLPALAATPIIAVSASVSGPDRAQSLAAGASAFVPKPIDQDELLAQIGRLLQLEWTYEQPAAAPSEAEVAQIGPPPDEAQALYELTMSGRILEIHARLDALAQRGPEYRRFVALLRDLTRRYRSRQIQAMLEPYIQRLPDDHSAEVD